MDKDLTETDATSYTLQQVDMYGAAESGVHQPPRKLGSSRAGIPRAPESKKPFTGLFAFLAPAFSVRRSPDRLATQFFCQ